MSTLGNTTVNGVVTQTMPASQPNHLIRLGEALQLLRSQLAGAWNGTTTFTQGMLVTWNNALYLLQNPTSANQQPDQNPSIWTLVLSGGVNGTNGQTVYV
ncbi:MAG: hypothetical protein KGL39_53240, partial [Patescibacteria group bacterium]|nr:hypothetical protein [Patescibacteria group bacterium]